MNMLTMTSMRIIMVFTVISIFFTLSMASKTSDTIISRKRLPRFISFDHKGGEIDVNLDLSIPFISVPLDDFNKPGEPPKSLVNINVKSLTFAAIFAAITAFIIPFFLKTSNNPQNYRLDNGFGFQEAGQALNELILGNNHVTPCVQQAVCSAVMRVKKSKIPSGTGKVIHEISNLAWFRNMVNGTAIDEAINIGYQPNVHCDHVFNNCELSSDVFQAIMDQLGIN